MFLPISFVILISGIAHSIPRDSWTLHVRTSVGKSAKLIKGFSCVSSELSRKGRKFCPKKDGNSVQHNVYDKQIPLFYIIAEYFSSYCITAIITLFKKTYKNMKKTAQVYKVDRPLRLCSRISEYHCSHNSCKSALMQNYVLYL